MIQRYNKILILLLVVFAVSNAFAQQIKGVVTDSVTHEPLMYISVYYQDKREMGTVTNIDGEYKLDARRNGGTLVFSSIGYVTKTVKVGSGNQTVNVKLSPDDVMLTEVVVKPQKEKYSRKNNPAVEFMKKVIEHKKAQVLEVNDYYQYDKYEKMKMSINDLTPEKLAEYQKAQGAVTSALGKLLAITENYPDLKANQNFLELQAQLEGTENRINVARTNFNNAAQAYNTAIRRFPKSLFASMFGFDKHAYFEAAEGTETAPTVSF